jgi:hypothetical protein
MSDEHPRPGHALVQDRHGGRPVEVEDTLPCVPLAVQALFDDPNLLGYLVERTVGGATMHMTEEDTAHAERYPGTIKSLAECTVGEAVYARYGQDSDRVQRWMPLRVVAKLPSST